MSDYIPERGDFIIVSLDPQSGHEQKGRHPALVISKRLFNERTGMVIVCPITNTDKKIQIHIAIPPNDTIQGFIMAEQVKAVDFRSRNAKYIGRASREIVEEVTTILDAFIN